MLYDRPLLLQQQTLEEDPERPYSAMALDYRDSPNTFLSTYRETMAGGDASQASGPSTAPSRPDTTTFFNED